MRVVAAAVLLTIACARKHPWQTATVFDLHEHGLLPEANVAGMRLESVHMVHRPRSEPGEKRHKWRLTHTKVPEEFDSRLFDSSNAAHAARGRLLSTTSNSTPRSQILAAAASEPFAFRTPRDKVRSITALLAASIPIAAYENVSFNYAQYGEVYDQGLNLFVKWCSNGTSGSGCVERANASYGKTLVETEGTVLTASREEIRAASGQTDSFLGARSTTCTSVLASEGRCFGDEGMAMSTYSDTDSTILVLQAGLGTTDMDNLIWQNKAWILEHFEDSLQEQWLISAQQVASENISYRTAEDTYEYPVRCAFLEDTYSPYTDTDAVTAGTDIARSYLEEEGLWPLVKQLVRTVLPEGTQSTKTVYLAGTGLGGSHAALASMWLKKNDDLSYDTYVIAAPGFQCIARDKYSTDLMHYDSHTQIKVYTHVMDALAGSVDQYSGTVCKYGLLNFTSAQPFYEACERMVGHTGPELFWRPSTTSTTTTLEADTQDATQLQYNANITAAQEAFDECHFFTHSIWYALMLFVSEDTLNLDGSTDGGCEDVDPIDQDDKYARCPTTTTVTDNCNNFFEPQASVSMEMLGIIVGSTGGVILCCALMGIAAVRHIQKNSMDDVGMSAEHGPPSSGFMARLLRSCGIYTGAGKRDRAKEARIRAKKARDKRKNRKEQEKTTLLEDGTEATPTPGVVVPSTTVGKQGPGEEEELPPDEGVDVELGAKSKEKKDKKEKKEKKQKKDKGEAQAEGGEPVDAISVRVLGESEAPGGLETGDDLLGSALDEKQTKKKKKKKNSQRDTE